MTDKLIVTFFGTYSVMKAERLVKKAGLFAEAIAAPRYISTDCGICIRINKIDEQEVLEIVKAAGLEINGVFDEEKKQVR
jgi:hypothetical protein